MGLLSAFVRVFENSMNSLEERFAKELSDLPRKIYKASKDYYPHEFERIIREQEPLVAVKNLLAANAPQYGLHRLYELGLLNLSMEFLVINPAFKTLFNKEDLDTATKRLSDLNFDYESESKKEITL